MKIAVSAGTTAPRLFLAGLIALAASACSAPNGTPADATQAADRARSFGQAAPASNDAMSPAASDDPVKAIGDALEQRMFIVIGSAQYGIFASY